jgi:hypothetical protein
VQIVADAGGTKELLLHLATFSQPIKPKRRCVVRILSYMESTTALQS